MAVLFPTALDTLDTGHVNDVEELIDALDINAIADAANKLEREVGIAANRTVINVKTHFGAVGDGSTDDTAAIQAAINAAPTKAYRNGNARCADIYFPPGEYVVSTLTFPKDQTYNGAWGCFITLRGPNPKYGATIKRKAAFTTAPLIDISGTMTAGVIKRTTGIYLKNLLLNGNDTGSQPLVRAYYTSSDEIEGVQFLSNQGPAVEGVEFQDTTFVDCWFNYCNGTVETVQDGSVVGQETVRLLGNADGNPAAGTTGYTTDNCNNIWFVNCRWTSVVSDNCGVIALSYNKSANGGALAPHRIYFVNNKIELGLMKGDPVKVLGSFSRAQWIGFVNCDFTGYTLGPTATSGVSWIRTNVVRDLALHNVLFDDGGGTGVTHAPLELVDTTLSVSGYCTVNLGAAQGGDTTAAALIHAGFTLSEPIVFSCVPRFSGSRTTPLFSGSAINDRRFPHKSGTSTQTPGAVTTVNIAHGLGYTPTLLNVQAASANARGAPAFHVTADGTNIILSFASALTVATAYAWNWTAS